jgi:hypothetical protein
LYDFVQLFKSMVLVWPYILSDKLVELPQYSMESIEILLTGSLAEISYTAISNCE